MNKLIPLYLSTISALWGPFVQAQEPADVATMQSMTTMEIMLKIITPATNVLWGISDNPDAAEWQAMEKAATINLEASELIAKGAASKQDRMWATEEQWQIYSKTMIDATEQILTAAQAKDIDAFYAGTDAIYPPCEECHRAFNPRIVNQ